MKKILIIIGSLIIIVGLAGGIWYWQKQKSQPQQISNISDQQGATPTQETSQQNSTSTWLTYKNDKYGFEFQYPEDFNLTESVRNIGLINKPHQSIGVHLSSKENSNINMDIEPQINNQTLNEAILNTINTIALNAEMGDGFNFDPKTVVVSTIMVGGLPAQKVVLNSDLVTEEVVVKDNSNLYMISQFKIDDFDQILSTFKFTGRGIVDLRLQPLQTTIGVKSWMSGATGVTFGLINVIVEYKSATDTTATLKITIGSVSETIEFQLNKEIVFSGFGFTLTSINKFSNGKEVSLHIVEK